MPTIVVEGGNSLSGKIRISGSKNASLPIMAASMLIENSYLENIPNVSDIHTMIDLLKNHGCEINFEKDKIYINSSKINNFNAPYEIVKKMRASIWVLGPLLAKFGRASVSMPGGCTLGARQVDLHIDGLRAMGASIEISEGYIVAEVKGKLKGTNFHFNKVSVGATINLAIAATLAEGETILTNCAIEPEVVDLCNFLISCGAEIEGQGTQRMIIKGSNSLKKEVRYRVISDRIEAGTYMIAAKITNGSITLSNIDYKIVENICHYLSFTGIEFINKDSEIEVISSGKIIPHSIETNPYPCFPTDLQAQYMTLMTVANGDSIITENIFENRLMHVPELCRMNANIKIQNHNTAFVYGVDHLTGAEVRSSDLRASVSLILAGLVAKGKTYVKKVHHLDRGYHDIERKLSSCGVKIYRIE